MVRTVAAVAVAVAALFGFPLVAAGAAYAAPVPEPVVDTTLRVDREQVKEAWQRLEDGELLWLLLMLAQVDAEVGAEQTPGAVAG